MSFVVLVVAVVWFLAALASMWVMFVAPEFSRAETVASWVFVSFLGALGLAGVTMAVGVFVSATR